MKIRAVFLVCAFSLIPLSGSAQSTTPSPAPTPAFESTDYRFTSRGTTLVGRLFAPRDSSKTPLVILVQGSDYDDANASVYWRLIAHTFAKNGIASFSFNKRGVAGSGGKQTDDFEIQAADVAAACAFASHLPSVDGQNVGYYGASQAGWIVPRAMRKCRGAFVILVSPGGIAPAETDRYYLQGQFASVGMTSAQARAAMALHDALARYYRTAEDYVAAQSLVDRATESAWFPKFQKIEFRQDVPDSHRLPSPSQLRAVWAARPDEYALYRDPNTWNEPVSLYETLNVPLLLVYGGADTDVPIERSIDVLEAALRTVKNHDVTIRIFEEADHSIQLGPRVLPGYREFLAEWVKEHLKA